jgi:DNA polymerase III subunit epsilon
VGDLGRIAGSCDRFAIVDVETTGLRDIDRIVEIAVVTVGLDGETVDEWTTLVNPDRDPGPTAIHGLEPWDLEDAPRFQEISFDLSLRLNGAAIVAHDLFGFDSRMIDREFSRSRIGFKAGSGVDTLQLSGEKLSAACWSYGIVVERAHTALDDARAAAELLRCVSGLQQREATPVEVLPVGTTSRSKPRTQAKLITQATWFQRMLASLPLAAVPSDQRPYVDLLERVLSDWEVTLDEQVQLMFLAKDLGLSLNDQQNAHRQFLLSVVSSAIDDGRVTSEELNNIGRFAEMLGLRKQPIVDIIRRFFP